jgi:hypothetical protein
VSIFYLEDSEKCTREEKLLSIFYGGLRHGDDGPQDLLIRLVYNFLDLFRDITI